MIKFREIRGAGGEEFAEAMSIYLDSFPPSERHAVEVVADRVNSGASQLYVGTLEGKVVFMALLWPLKTTDFILLDYMATKDGQRGKGFASTFLNEMRPRLSGSKRYFILEVESPASVEDRAAREKRVSFYRHHGAKEMKGVRYLLPPLDGNKPTEMILMLFPEYEGGRVDGLTVKRLITQMYSELYNRGADDELLRSFIDDVGDAVELV